VVIGQPPLKTESSILPLGETKNSEVFGMGIFFVGKECIFF